MMTRTINILLAAWDFVDSYYYDVWRYWHHSQAFGRFRSHKTASAYILMTVHTLEKGLSLPDLKRGFGKAKCREIMGEVLRFQQLFGSDPVCQYSIEVIGRVIEFHASTGDTDEDLVARFATLQKTISKSQTSFDAKGGVRQVFKSAIAATLPPNAYQFFASRHSVRQFAEGNIAEESIRDAVRIAQRSPSVCNRQTCRLHYSTNPEIISKALIHQTGASGFGQHGKAIFVITSELSAFNRAGERNQAYVDGGIFAQTFALGMHALGFGTCFLNWSKTARQDRKFRRMLNIPESEVIVTLMLGGCLLEEFVVAVSPRIPTDEVMHRL